MKYLFSGEDVQLGRFGLVRKGDVLELTPHEAQCITDTKDKRFKKLNEKEALKVEPGQFITITDDMTPQERADAESANKAEQARLDGLAQSNDAERVFVQEVKEMTYPQLEAYVEKMNTEAGREVIQYDKKKTRKGDLVSLILAARRQAQGLPPEPTAEKDGAGEE